ncbi:MAG TPA: Maf family protein, partial [Saprospiraceae bacterium]|nr:Maf family protein [Saprospiraceae bacterium]
GVSLYDGYKLDSFSVETKVFFNELLPEEIEYYIQRFQPFDKAGSYGIQEWIGHCKIKKIVGSYTNVMGLPTAELYEAIHKF